MYESAACPNITRRLREQCSPNWIEIYHRTGGTQRQKDHSACTKTTCFANDLRSSRIIPRHTSLGCSCLLLGANLQQLQQALELHDVALIRLDERDQNIEINVEPMVNGMKYFALSHALADGLCNTERNELPQCQLRRILRSVKSAMLIEELPQDYPVFVWIDILCLPLRSSPSHCVTSNLKTLRRVMGNAVAVVVLDTDIADLSQDSSYAERFLKVSFSSWGSRLWTLFEAILAQKLLFECKDGVMELKDFRGSSSDVVTIEEAADWRPLLYARLGKPKKAHKDDHALLSRALKWCRTSVDSDPKRLKDAIASQFLPNRPEIDSHTSNHQQRL